MAKSLWSSHLKPKIARTSHTFVISDFLSKLKMSDLSPLQTFSSAKFSTPDPSNVGSHFEFQIVVTIQSPSGTQSAVERSANVSLVSVAASEDSSNPPIELNVGADSVHDGPHIYNGLNRHGYGYIKNWNQHRIRGPPPVVSEVAPVPAIPVTPLKCKFWILGKDHKPVTESKHLQGYFKRPGPLVDCKMDLNLKNIMEEPTGLLRLDHSLEICCLIEVNCGNELVMEMTSPLDPDQSLHRRLSPKHFPDMNLVSRGVRFPCHKHMLAASSDVFMAMFSNFQENKSQEVLIDIVYPNALKKLLEYVYSDDIADMDGYEVQLIYVADKYNMANLRTFATNYVVTTFSIENVSLFLTVGELIQSEFLTQKAFEFAYDHADEVIKSDGWKSLSQNSMKRLLELTMKFGKM